MARLRKAKLPGPDTGSEVRHAICDICAPGSHCGVDLYIKDGTILKLEGSAQHPQNRGLLCTKGQAGRQYVYRPDRILSPLRRTGPRGSGQFEPITWDEAYREIADRLTRIRDESGPEAVAFFSGYSKWYRPFLRRFAYSFGSPNYGSESSTCNNAAEMVWKLNVGTEKAKPDLAHAGIFLGFGYNGYYSRYQSTKGVEKARERGMKVILIDPRRTLAADRFCDLHLQLIPGTDGALAHALARILIREGWVDRDFIEKNVYGFEEYAAYVDRFDPETAAQITGVPAEQILTAARMLHEYAPACVNESSAPILHHKNGMQNYRAMTALTALLGSFDKVGGQIPTTYTYAHSMANFATRETEFADDRRPPIEMVGQRRFPLWAELIGEMQACDLSRQILEGNPYPIRALFALGMNHRMFNASDYMKQALSEVEFYVDADLFMTDSAKLADIVLPSCSSFERGEFKVYPNCYAAFTRPAIQPLGQSKPDTDILTELAERLDLDDPLLRAGYDACIRWILQDTGIDIDMLKEADFPVQFPELSFPPPGNFRCKTPTGKFELISTVIERMNMPGLDALPTYSPSPDDADPAEYPLLLCSGGRLPNALHSRLHSVSWLRSLRPDPTAELNPEDAARYGLKAGDDMELRTPEGSIIVKAEPNSRIRKGVVHFYHGYPEADVNTLIGREHNDPYSGFPGFNSVRCAVSKREGAKAE